MSGTGLIRCFVAVELPGELKARIERETACLRRSVADVKWVPAENLHFTIKFLGGVPEEEVSRLEGILKEAVRGTKPFEIEIAGAGVFPGMKSPRVFWIGTRDPASGLKGLADRVEDALERAGYPREQRGFTPHITLGRLRAVRGVPGGTSPGGTSPGGTSPAEREAIAGARTLADDLATLKDVLFGKIRLENISLMRSELAPGGAKYSRLAAIRLGGG